MNLDKKQYVILASILLVVCTASFYVGSLYSKKNVSEKITSNGRNSQFGQNGNGERLGKGMNGQNKGGIFGEILSNDGTTMTVKLRDGGSKIVLLSGSTKIEKTIDGASRDLEVGKSVVVGGDQNPDGSVTANSIQLRTFMPGRDQVFGGEKVLTGTK